MAGMPGPFVSPDSETEIMELEELTEAISFSFSLGLNITGLPQ
jgi:hypothetical protein